MSYQDTYIRSACYGLIEGVVFEDESEVTAATNVLKDANIPFHDKVGIETENFDEDHLRFAIMAGACSRLIDDWSYFIFIAEVYGKNSKWLRFLPGITTVRLQNEGIEDPTERIDLAVYLYNQYERHIASETGIRKKVNQIGKFIGSFFPDSIQ